MYVKIICTTHSRGDEAIRTDRKNKRSEKVERKPMLQV